MGKTKRKPKELRDQYVLSQKGKVLVEKYLTKKGQTILLLPALPESKKEKKARVDAIWAKYGKNRYRVNPDAHIVKRITHSA